MSIWDPEFGPLTGAAQSAQMTTLNAQQQGNAVLPTSFSVTSSTEAVIPNPQNLTAALLVPLPPNLPGVEKTPMDFIASGELKTLASGTIDLKIYSGISTTVGSDTKIADSGAVTQNTATAAFEFHVHFVLDSTPGTIGGWFEGFINNTLIARTALSSVLSGLSNAANPVINLLMSLTSSGATSGNPTTITLQKFGFVG
jgi:hypothetical protein